MTARQYKNIIYTLYTFDRFHNLLFEHGRACTKDSTKERCHKYVQLMYITFGWLTLTARQKQRIYTFDLCDIPYGSFRGTFGCSKNVHLTSIMLWQAKTKKHFRSIYHYLFRTIEFLFFFWRDQITNKVLVIHTILHI